jgi:hypothetical protein
MLINPDEVVTGALVNAIAVVGRQVSKAVAGLRKTDEDLATARWFETFRLTGTPPDLPGLSPASSERLTELLGGDEMQAALQELLAVRLTDAPETDASRARDAVRVALSTVGPDAAAFGGALAGYYDDQICALVARLEGEEPPMLAQIRSEAFSSRMISILHGIERHTAALAGSERWGGGRVQGGRLGDGRAAGRAGDPPAGRLLAEVTDPFDLEVHRPVQADDPLPGLPELPTYVPREHDRELAELVRAAAEGASGIAMLVGGSSTGKTRACWEALGLLRKRPERWRLWHPINPSRPEAALRELPSIGPLTVVWLNEAQLYLDVAADELGEQVAAGLRELLRDPARAPVLVLATLWQEFWDRLTACSPTGEDPHAQARELLTGRDISVPATFTATQVQQLTKAGDPRLAQAAEAAEDRQVTQFLAGAPELMARYRNAPPAAAALITAAIDARRLGMGIALPLAFLEAAAPGYLTDADWDGLGEDWLEQALAYTAAPCRGIRGPLSRIRPRPSRTAAPFSGPVYRLADYLEQHGRHTRRRYFPPADFWAAVASFAAPHDLPALAEAARNRGLLRDAARLCKHAAAHGDTSSAIALLRQWRSLHSGDHNPAQWVAQRVSLDHLHVVARLLEALREADADEQANMLASRAATDASFDDPSAIADLLGTLRKVGADKQAAALLARDPAAHAPVDDPTATVTLEHALRRADADEQANMLASRAAAAAPLDKPEFLAWLLGVLQQADVDEQAKTLANLAALHAPLQDPSSIAELLAALRKAGAVEHARALADRAAADARLDDPFLIAWLLEVLRRAGADKQAAVLLARDPGAHAPLDDPSAIADLLNALRKAGADEQAKSLANRVAAHRDPAAVAWLLGPLQEAGADEQVKMLANRVAAHAPLDEPYVVAWLLNLLREAGADKQTAALLARDPAAHAPLDDPSAIADLLDALRKAGADEQANTLAGHAAARVPLNDPYVVARLLNLLRGAGGDHQAKVLASRVAAQAPLDNPRVVAELLDVLREAGADKQTAALLARDPAAHAPLDDPSAIADLLNALRKAGADEQVETLAGHAALHAPLDNLLGVAWLLKALRAVGANEQIKVLAGRAAAQAPLDNPHVVPRLLAAMREAGADEQASALVDQLSAEGRFDLFRGQADHQMRYRFGREPNGHPAPSWGWADLD